MGLFVVSCNSTSVDQSSPSEDATCGLEPASFTDVPEPVPGRSERQRELSAATLREWQDQLSEPLEETVARLGPLLANAGFIEDPAEAWDSLYVYVLLDPPIPLRILDEVMTFLPAEVTFNAYVELDGGYPMLVSGSSSAELVDWFDGVVLAGTTTTVLRGQPAPSGVPDRGELAGLTASERDLRLVIPVYAIPATFLRGAGYDVLPLRQMVTGVEVRTDPRGLGGWAKPRDELFTTSAGWRFCREVAEILGL